MLDTDEIAAQIIKVLGKSVFRYELHCFPSGCKMIDLWVGDNFYCIQVEHKRIGISLVTAEVDFSTIPDQSFPDFADFSCELERILSP